MAFNPVGQQYKPDPLADPGASQKPFQEANVPKTGSIVSVLLRLAMRRLVGFGHAATPQTKAVKNPMTMGSHGKIV